MNNCFRGGGCDNKKIGRKIILVILLTLLMFYSICILASTHHIMVDLKQIENGYKINNSAYEWFESTDIWKIDNIKRYFTWCWGDKGAIWITCTYSLIEDGKIEDTGRDFTKLIIEKKERKMDSSTNRVGAVKVCFSK